MKILIAEDDQTLRTLMSAYLMSHGHEVVAAADGAEALACFAESQPDLVILDVMMPGTDGWQTLAEIRQRSPVPVIFLTALGNEEEVVRGLEMGADDYLRKPIGMKELAARIEIIQRRAGSASGPPTSYKDECLEIDLVRRQVMVNGQDVHLTPTEFRLLAYLVGKQGQPVMHRELLREVWGPEYTEDIASLQVYVRYLREKIEPDPRKPLYILTEWGVGYRFTGE